MRRKPNKLLLIPLPFILVVVILIANLDLPEGSSELLFIVVFFVSIFYLFVVAKFTYGIESKSWFNADKVKNLDTDLYEHYSTLTKGFTFEFTVGEEIGMPIDDNDKLRIEHLVVMLVKHPRYFLLYRRQFEEMHQTSGKYYQLMHIYALSYLLDNDVTKFIIHYGHYKNTIAERPEVRIMGQLMSRISFGLDEYDVPEGLLNLLYIHYAKDKDVSKLITKFQPVCKLDEMVYTILLHYYWKNNENKAMLEDIEPEYQRFHQIKKSLEQAQ